MATNEEGMNSILSFIAAQKWENILPMLGFSVTDWKFECVFKNPDLYTDRWGNKWFIDTDGKIAFASPAFQIEKNRPAPFFDIQPTEVFQEDELLSLLPNPQRKMIQPEDCGGTYGNQHPY